MTLDANQQKRINNAVVEIARLNPASPTYAEDLAAQIEEIEHTTKNPAAQAAQQKPDKAALILAAQGDPEKVAQIVLGEIGTVLLAAERGVDPSPAETEAAGTELDRREHAAQHTLTKYRAVRGVDPEALREASVHLRAVRDLRRDIAEAGRSLPRAVTGKAWNLPVPPREWLLQGWLPAGELSMLAGPGETGKSLLLLQLCTALAADRTTCSGDQWLPRTVGITGPNAPHLCAEPVTVVIAGWEDSDLEALRRRERLHMYGGCGWAADASINNRLHVLPMRGFGPVWAPADTGSRHISTVGEITPTGQRIRRYCEQHAASLLVLDPSSLALSLNENDRALVSIALESWAGWANQSGCAVMLTAHPAKAKEGEGSDYSGSTAWRGLVRALWTLRQPETPDKKSTEWTNAMGTSGKERVADLTLNKANYAMSGETLHVATEGRRAGWRMVDPIPKQPKKTRKSSSGNAQTAPTAPAATAPATGGGAISAAQKAQV